MASRSTDPLRSTNGNSLPDCDASKSISRVVAYISSRKRLLQDTHTDDMADVDHEDASSGARIRESKKANLSHAPTPVQSYIDADDAIAGPSFSSLRQSHVPVDKATLANAQAEAPHIDLPKSNAVPPPRRGEGIVNDLQDELQKLRREVENLKEQLGLQVKNQEAAKLQTVQQMMLDRLREQKQNVSRMESLGRQKYYALIYAKEQANECEKMQKKVEEGNKKCAKLASDVNYLKDDIEHLQALNKAMEEDLDELRQIDNEDRGWRRRYKNDLPPAYGSLDDDIDAAEVTMHQDSGSFDVASLKRTVNRELSATILGAQKTAEAIWEAGTSSADNTVFLKSSLALADASRVLKAALDCAETLSVTTVKVAAEEVMSGSSRMPSRSNEGRYVIARTAPRREYTADRIVKMLLNLVWRVIAATELRPVTLSLQPRDKTMLCLAYKEVDDTFQEALRQAFTLGESKRSTIGRLHEFQHYLTQLNGVRRSFDNLRSGLSYSLFKKSWEWLSEEVELERMRRANQENLSEECSPDETHQGQEFESEVSSEQTPTESDFSGSESEA